MEQPAVKDCIPKKSWGEIMDELDELGELDCDGAESLQSVNQSLISEEIRDLLLEYEKRYEAMEKERKHLKTKAKFLKLTKLEVTEQLESRLREKDAQISTMEQEIMQLNEMFEMHKSKNNNREYNAEWAAADFPNSTGQTCHCQEAARQVHNCRVSPMLTKLVAVEQLENSLKEKDAEIATLEHEIVELSEIAGTQRIKTKN